MSSLTTPQGPTGSQVAIRIPGTCSVIHSSTAQPRAITALITVPRAPPRIPTTATWKM